MVADESGARAGSVLRLRAGFHWGALLARAAFSLPLLLRAARECWIAPPIGRAQQDSNVRVAPPAVDERVGHAALANISVVDVGDFEFTAPAGYQLLTFSNTPPSYI